MSRWHCTTPPHPTPPQNKTKQQKKEIYVYCTDWPVSAQCCISFRNISFVLQSKIFEGRYEIVKNCQKTNCPMFCFWARQYLKKCFISGNCCFYLTRCLHSRNLYLATSCKNKMSEISECPIISTLETVNSYWLHNYFEQDKWILSSASLSSFLNMVVLIKFTERKLHFERFGACEFIFNFIAILL